ncbi:aspartic proteinase 36-like [Wolffia australiana]
MELERKRIVAGRGIPSSVILQIAFVFALICSGAAIAGANVVIQVRRRFASRDRLPGELRAHDARRHGRKLAAVNLPIGGIGLPSDAGLYYAQIAIGNPSKSFYVQVDTGSDILWVNCVQCTNCPHHSDLGLDLTLYDPQGSTTGGLVRCDQDFCKKTYGELEGCKPNNLCSYSILYGDGSGTSGFFVSDNLHYDQVVGDNKFQLVNGSVTFGCGARQSGDLGSSNGALDGILGFGQSNSSMISQLASAGKVRKMFSHCLDSVNGGGIFALGEVVEPKMNTTPLIPNQPHYNVLMKGIDVGGQSLRIPSDSFDVGQSKGAIIDSGTTLAYLPESVYRPLINAIFASQPTLDVRTLQDFLCFIYTASVDDGFPVVTLHFENSLSLRVYPHDYLFENRGNIWCVGWQSSGVQSRDGKDTTILGDLVLSNKLVFYDLENQEIGWTEYNCSSSIKVRDRSSGVVYSIKGQNISSACRFTMGRLFLFLIIIAKLYCLM